MGTATQKAYQRLARNRDKRPTAFLTKNQAARSTPVYHPTMQMQHDQAALDDFVNDARRGDMNGVLAALACGVPVNCTDRFGYTALFSATSTRQHDVLELLLRTPGIDVNRRCFSETPLYRAAKSGCVRTLKTLLAAGGDVRAVNAEGRTVLMAAVTDVSTAGNGGDGDGDNAADAKVAALLAHEKINVLVTDAAGATAETLALRCNRRELATVIAAEVSQHEGVLPCVCVSPCVSPYARAEGLHLRLACAMCG